MLHRLPFRAMGSQMLAVVERETEDTPAVMACIPEWFEAWEQCLSRFRYDSELSRLNRTADQPVPVSETLWEVFQACRDADRMTGGLVSPTVLGAVENAGYDRPFDDLPAGGGFTGVWADIRPLSLVISDAVGRSICLPPGVGLDLGGVAKGWAAEQAAGKLKASGPALMNAGGDIAVHRPRLNGEAWLVGISNPFQPGEDLAVLHLHGGGVATSGKDRRRWKRGDQLFHHIIDPRIGLPAATDVLTATIVAPTVMEAEAAAKAVLILGSGAGMEWLETDSSLAGLLILDNGRVLASRGMDAYL